MNKLIKNTSVIKVHPKDLPYVEKIFNCGQDHIFRWWCELSDIQRKKLLRQISSIDFSLLQELITNHIKVGASASGGHVPLHGKIEPPDIIPIPGNDAQLAAANEAKTIGENALCKGKVAILTVAGGLGTRLGFDVPKGCIPIGPITGKSLFQLHAEKILAIIKRYRTELPWYIMTSEANHTQTKKFFQDNHFFNLKPSDVIFFTQGMLPVADLNGRLIMDAKCHIAMSPNGHGGVILALKKEKVLANMKKRGIEYIFYFQVDNALIKIADPTFIGYHILDHAEMSSKVTTKRSPEEKVGILGYVDGKLGVIEYSELNEEDLQERNKDGSLRYNTGNIAIHILNVEFVEKLNNGGFKLPYHKALKCIPFLNNSGELVTPEENSGVKFETFIFDAMKYSERSVVMEVVRKDEFAPIKNMEGDDSPDIARQAMINMFGRWLSEAGVNVPFDAQHNVKGVIEISPLYALDSEELKRKIKKSIVFNGRLELG
ncbi:MAG TPA: UTP--glucose-1-phosphate uridylyltransferase [Candidatus Brocadiia bacterium]|nr:UDPGP type 1 family protein [Candidatus Brocadiales bacterium]